jgi:ceramide glucosyltransferase
VTVLVSALAPVLLTVTLVSLAYVAFALWQLCAFLLKRRTEEGRHGAVDGPPVTVLKPLCGLEPDLYTNLRSFCEQDYPVVQVVFAVRDGEDPAIGVVEQLIRDLPDRDLALVVDGRVYGANHKASNLVNAYESAKHDVIVVADSDMRVDRRYLERVGAPLADPSVGVVTCLYVARPHGGLWSTLGAMLVNEWFVPSVLVAHTLQPGSFCFGSTMVIRRAVLDRIGGFQSLAPHLADDYVLGARVRAEGLRIALSSYVVENVVAEPSWTSLMQHELRWARTVRSVRPIGYSLSFVTYSLPLALGCALVAAWGDASWRGLPTGLVGALAGTALALRLATHYVASIGLAATGARGAWLVPLRDVLGVMVWAASFCGRTVWWRGRALSVMRGGRLETESASPAGSPAGSLG